MANETFLGWMAAVRQQVESTLDHKLPAAQCKPQRLHEAMRYATLGGGKRTRSLLVFAAGELVGADNTHLAQIAAAVEMIHAYSLVHDDMPCMDDDALRRGKVTCHVAYDEATALLVGDALQSQAFYILSISMAGIAPDQQLAMMHILARAAGSAGMAGGQAIDLFSVAKILALPELECMHLLKTGALIRASVLLGAMAGSLVSDETTDQLDIFAKQMGLAFQVVDDILDYESDTVTLGKTAGKDAANNKPTYVSLMGVAQAKNLTCALRDAAFAALTSFGCRAQRLKELADYIIARSY